MTRVADRVRGLPMWRPLAVRDFRLLWSSAAVSLTGDQFHYIALSWLVLQLTGSGLALGAVLIASGVPRALMLIPAGVLADRMAPRLLIAWAHLVRGAIVAGMAALVLGGAPSLPVLVALTVAFGIADAVFLRRVDPALLGRVMSLSMLMSVGATPISLGLAGLLVDLDATLMFGLAGGLVLATLVLGVVLRLPALMDEDGVPALAA